MRRSLSASARHERSATTATAPATIATTPAVLVRLSTGGSIGSRHDARPPDQAMRQCAAPAQLPYWNVTGKTFVLCVKVVSPGTCPIVTLTLYWPFGGDALSGI